MYSCPSCGANIRFDIATQMLKCGNCDTVVDPYEMDKGMAQEPSENMSVTAYTCSQCGGEIIADSNEAAAFCSYCGASTVLESRIKQIRKPDYIIPFSVDKASCARAFNKKLKGSLFAPSNLCNENNITNFRGIYMPYWIYSFKKDGIATTTGVKRYRRGNYDYTEHYDISVPVNYDYAGVGFDASSSFADNLSQAIAPYDTGKTSNFTPAYLSGFYADVSDVPSNTYEVEAGKAVANECAQRVRSNLRPGLGIVPDLAKLNASMQGSCYRRDLGYFPVWFMSYRTDTVDGEDRICYMVVNGQTGRAAGDVPVSLNKYLVAVGILTVIIFVLLNMGATLIPSTLLGATIALNFFGLITNLMQDRKITRWENGTDDKGMIAAKGRSQKSENNSKDKGIVYTILSILSIALGALIIYVNPVSDIIFYMAVIFGCVISFMEYIRLIKRFNKLTSRPLPQFKRTGGDDSAVF